MRPVGSRLFDVFVLVAALGLGGILAPAVARADTPAQRENAQGLRAHRRGDFAAARARFEKAVALDVTLTIARFNAACAAARQGETAAARAHVAEYLRVVPAELPRVLHDSDLASLRRDAAWLRALETQARAGRRTVRSLLVERRETGGDLFVVDEDGFGERPFAADPGWREWRPSVTADGGTVVYLASRFEDRPVLPRRMGEGHPQRDWSDVRQQGRLYQTRFDHELRAAPWAGGAHRVLATRVHWYRLDPDGRTVLFVDEPTAGQFRVASIPAAGGPVTTLADTRAASAWCAARTPSGGLVLAEGFANDWTPTLRIAVSRIEAGRRSELLAPRRPGPRDPVVPDFELCELGASGQELHLGAVRVVLGATPRIERVPGVEMGSGAYNFRHVGERGSAGRDGAVYLTVVGRERTIGYDDESGAPTRTPPPLWSVSPLSWTNSNGMSDDWWYPTRVVRVAPGGAAPAVLSTAASHVDYAPAVSPDGTTVALTTVRTRGPWIVLVDPVGGGRRAVAPGQFAVWNPVARPVR